MAKKAAASGDGSDPKANKSLAIRTVLQKMPTAKPSEVQKAVKAEFGHTVSANMVYLVKTKLNVKKGTKASVGQAGKMQTPMNSAASWLAGIRAARALVAATGSSDNAKALIDALDD